MIVSARALCEIVRTVALILSLLAVPLAAPPLADAG